MEQNPKKLKHEAITELQVYIDKFLALKQNSSWIKDLKPLPLNFNDTFDPTFFHFENKDLLENLYALIQNSTAKNPKDCAPIYLLKTSGCGKTKLACSLYLVPEVIVIPIRLSFGDKPNPAVPH